MPFDTLALVCFGVFLAALIVLVNTHRARDPIIRRLLRVGCAVVMLAAVAGLIVDSVPPPPLVLVNVPANVPASLSILAMVRSGSPEAGFAVESLRGSNGSVRWQASLSGGRHYVTLAQGLLVTVPQGRQRFGRSRRASSRPGDWSGPSQVFALDSTVDHLDPLACDPAPALTAFSAATGSIFWQKAVPDGTLQTLIGTSG